MPEDLGMRSSCRTAKPRAASCGLAPNGMLSGRAADAASRPDGGGGFKSSVSDARKAAAEAGVSLPDAPRKGRTIRSEEHTSELQSLMRISYAVFCLKKKKPTTHESTKQRTPTKKYHIVQPS